jgi:hypothetical protein
VLVLLYHFVRSIGQIKIIGTKVQNSPGKIGWFDIDWLKANKQVKQLHCLVCLEDGEIPG